MNTIDGEYLSLPQAIPDNIESIKTKRQYHAPKLECLDDLSISGGNTSHQAENTGGGLIIGS